MPERSPSAKKYSVALLIETSSNYGRQILRGIHRFIETEKGQDWLAVLEERDLNSGVPDWIQRWSGDGIISRQTTSSLQAAMRLSDIAFVDLNDRVESKLFSTVRSDDFEIGRIAAEHFKERGIQNLAFCGFQDESWSEQRELGFREEATKDRKAKYFSLNSEWFARDAILWEQEKNRILKWLQQLPTPIGVLAANDIRGKQVIDCCLEAGISVPESVAVVGVDNDELLCNFSRIPLTSVIPNAERIGYRAAQILSQMFEDRDAKKVLRRVFHPEHERILPLGIFSRRSSDIVSVDDQELAAALRFIREKACEGITVADVVKASGMSRSTIERKMRSIIQRTPQQEIRRVQLRQVCTLLAGTDLPIEAIALQCGFEHPEYLHVVFKREMKVTPGDYRIGKLNTEKP